ncbi:MAG: hypothetical protein AAF557_25520 [Pseudomonadota bacterium]
MKRLLRYALIMLFVFGALVANHIYVVKNGISRDSDYTYFAQNCDSGITPEEAANMTDHIYYDRGIDHTYILNTLRAGSDQGLS